MSLYQSDNQKMEASCEKTMSKVLLYFISVFSLLFSLANLVTIAHSMPRTDSLETLIEVTSTILHLMLGILLLTGVIMYKTRYVEMYNFLCTSLLLITSAVTIIVVCTANMSIDFCVGVLVTRWVMQLFVFWGYNLMYKNDKLSESQNKEENMEKPIFVIKA